MMQMEDDDVETKATRRRGHRVRFHRGRVRPTKWLVATADCSRSDDGSTDVSAHSASDGAGGGGGRLAMILLSSFMFFFTL